MSEPLPYYNNCVNWPPSDVHDGLSPMADAGREVTRRTFLKHINRQHLAELEHDLGYRLGHGELRMSRDWHVRYFRSKLHGRRCYFICHSAIEYVFAKP